MPKEPAVLGIVLSGGAGRRVDGQDKGLLVYKDQPLVAHVLGKLKPQVEQICISIHRNQETYQRFGFPITLDQSVEFDGPMAGMTSVLTAFDSENTLFNFSHLVVAPCDVPHLPSDYVIRLMQALGTHKADCAVVHDGERRQNLHCLFTAKMAPSLLDFYSQGGRAMHQWFNSVTTVDADFSDCSDNFDNFNTLKDLAELS